MLCLEYAADSTVLAWAQGVINEHPDMPTIIDTHMYFTPNGDYDPYAAVIWNGLIDDNSQIFMLVCGHHDSQGPKYNVRYNAAGKTVYELMTDYQQTDLGGGYLRLLEFDEDDSVIRASAYSPYYDLYHDDLPLRRLRHRDGLRVRDWDRRRWSPATPTATASWTTKTPRCWRATGSRSTTPSGPTAISTRTAASTTPTPRSSPPTGACARRDRRRCPSRRHSRCCVPACTSRRFGSPERLAAAGAEW